MKPRFVDATKTSRGRAARGDLVRTRLRTRLQSHRMFVASLTLFSVVDGCALCPDAGCEYVVGTNWEGRHRFFVEDLESAVGKSFHDVCVGDGTCTPAPIGAGLVRWTVTDQPPWMHGCTYWYDVEVQTNIVKAVGYRGEREANGRQPCWTPLQGAPRDM